MAYEKKKQVIILRKICYLQQTRRNLDKTLQKKANFFQSAMGDRCDNI